MKKVKYINSIKYFDSNSCNSRLYFTPVDNLSWSSGFKAQKSPFDKTSLENDSRENIFLKIDIPVRVILIAAKNDLNAQPMKLLHATIFIESTISKSCQMNKLLNLTNIHLMFISIYNLLFTILNSCDCSENAQEFLY